MVFPKYPYKLVSESRAPTGLIVDFEIEKLKEQGISTLLDIAGSDV